jgi:hypothetical protein
MMTRKDYISTAEILNKNADELGSNLLDKLTNDFIEMFASDNPRFDFDRFWEACFKDRDLV